MVSPPQPGGLWALRFWGALSVASLEACLGGGGAEAHLEDVLISGGGF